MNLGSIILEALAAGFAFGAGRGLGDWTIDRVRLRAERGVPLWPLRREDDDFADDFRREDPRDP